jgi:FkbM family methyltransferase
MKFVKRSLRKIFNDAGYEIVNIKVAQAENEKRRWAWLRSANFGTVLDIGANVGQFAGLIQKYLPDASLYSFEPIPECYNALVLKMKSHTNFKSFNLALGDLDGETDFFVSEFSPSSSLLPMGKLHRELFPETASSVIRPVTIARLDSLANQIVVNGNLLIKMDVQGAEDKIIRGGIEFFKRANAVLTEISYESMYVGQPLFRDIHSMLDELGFRFSGTMFQQIRPSDQLPIYGDALFVNTCFSEL